MTDAAAVAQANAANGAAAAAVPVADATMAVVVPAAATANGAAKKAKKPKVKKEGGATKKRKSKNDDDEDSGAGKKSKKKSKKSEKRGGSDDDDDSGEKKKKKKKKRAKRVRDPNEPKKPLSVYLVFSGSVQKQVKEANPNLSQPERAKIIGARWGAMTEEEKKPFRDQYAAQMPAYEAAIKAYRVDHPKVKASSRAADSDSDSDDSGRKKRKRKHRDEDPNRPKAPPSSFLMWSRDERKKRKETDATFAKQDNTEQSKTLGTAWKGMSEADKRPWVDRYNAAKKIFVEVRAKYDEEKKKAAEAAKSGAGAMPVAGVANGAK